MNMYDQSKQLNKLGKGVLLVVDKKNNPVRAFSGLISFLHGNALMGYCFDKKSQRAFLARDEDMRVIRIYKSNGPRCFPEITEVDTEDPNPIFLDTPESAKANGREPI